MSLMGSISTGTRPATGAAMFAVPPKAEVKSGILTADCGTADEARRGAKPAGLSRAGRGVTGIADTVSCPSARAAPSA